MLPAFQLEKQKPDHADKFSPDGLDLSDTWVVKLVRSDLKKEERFKRWPKVFSPTRTKASHRNAL